MTLPGCARHLADSGPPEVHAVKVEDRAPAELTRCPVPPAGFPEDQNAWAVVPPAVRAAAIGLAAAYAEARAQLERLIQWETGETCPPGEPAR
ncbi:MAG TPA: hypothetical protein VGD10_08105 [Allosphingosinicella sp.]|uniref:hypothetical protein n=1 Tax=Allosphingosinicella sp. TaxID=2823234 RepID=UPI002ED97EB0